MNKVYKVIWSKAKNCYVVASELAKSHTKAPKSGVMSRALVAGVLACVLSCGAVLPVYADDYYLDGDTSFENNGYFSIDGSLISDNVTVTQSLPSSIFLGGGSGFVTKVIDSSTGKELSMPAFYLGNGSVTQISPDIFKGYFVDGNNNEIPYFELVPSGNNIWLRATMNMGRTYISGFKNPETGEVIQFSGSESLYNDVFLSRDGDTGYWFVSSVRRGGASGSQALNVQIQENAGSSKAVYPEGTDLSVTNTYTAGDLTINNSTISVSNNVQMNNNKLTVNDSNLLADGTITAKSISSSNSFISGESIKTTSGDIDASTSDLTATESVESAGVVKAKSVNAPRLLGAGSGMSTLGGGLTVAGQVKGVTAGTADTDAMNYGQGKVAIKGLSVSGKTITYTKIDGSTGTITTQDTDTHYTTHLYAGSGTAANANTTNGNTKLTLADNSTVRESITIKGTGATTVTSSGGVITINSTDNNTTYSPMTGATASAAGTAGLVPAPAAGKQTAFLRGDGTWVVPTDTNTHYTTHLYAGTGAAANAATSNGSTKIALTDDSTVRNTLTIKGTGATTVTSDANGVITINSTDNNTTYSAATQSANGLMTAADKKKLDGIASGANAYTLPAATSSALGGVKIGSNITNTDGTISLTKANVTAALGYTPPTTDTNTTYDNMSATELSTGTATTARSISAKTIADYVTGKVSAETTARTSAVSSEATTRANADTALGTRIDNTITAYESADTGLSNRIGSLSADGNYIKKSATNNVSANLTALDTQLKTTATAVSTETTNRTNADTVLSNRIGSLSTDGNYIKKADTKNVSENLSLLDTQVKANATAVSNEITNRTTAITNEASARSSADTALGTRIDNAISDYQSADTGLSNRIGSLASDGNYIKKADTNNVSENLTVLDTQLKSLEDRLGSATVADGSTGSTSIGDGSGVNGNNSVSIGDGSGVTGDNSVAIGADASTNESDTVAVGGGSSASGEGSTSLGAGTSASGIGSTALGNNANSFGNGSVALGNDSVAGTDGVVSVGHKAGDTDAQGNTYVTNEFRRIINVANGVDANDVATVGQMNTAINVEASARTAADTALSDRIGTLLNDGNYIKKSDTNNVSQNLTVLDTQMKTNVDRIAELESRIGTATVTDGSTGSSAVGDGSSVTGDDSVAVGDGSSVSGNDSVSVGNGSSVDGDSSVSVGKDATVTGDHSLGLGGGASVEGNNSVGIGDGSEVIGNNSVALGTNASSTEDNAVSIGSDSTASGDGAVSLGTGASATNTNSVALGNNAHSSADNSVALGSNSVADTENVISVGHKAGDTDAIGNTYTTNEFRRIINVANGIEANDAATVGQMNTALDDRIGTISADGNYIKKSDTNNVSENLTVLDTELKTLADRIGSSTVSAGSTGSTAIGDGSDITGNNSVGVGDNSKVTGDESVSVGTGSSVEGNDSVSLGNDSTVTGDNSVGIGSGTTVDGDNAVSIGKDSEVTANDGIALGNEASSTESGAISIGSGSSSTGVNATSVGTGTKASGNHSTALGDGANALGDSSISLGSNSVAGTDGVVSVGHKAGDLDVNGNTYTTNEFRRIINVADGVDAHDVVTVGQMNQQLATINNYNTTLDARIGTLASDGNYIRSSATNDVAANLMALDTQLKATDVSSLKYDGDDHSLVTMGGASGTKLTNLKQGTLSDTSTDAVTGAQLYAVKQDIIGFAGDINRNKASIRDLNASISTALESVSSTGELVSTMDDLKADASLNNLTAAGQQVITNAAVNAVQEYMASQAEPTLGVTKPKLMGSPRLMAVNPAPANTNYVVYDDITADTITLEGNVGTGTKITNVAEAELSAASMDAVNGSQLYAVTQQFDEFQSVLSKNNTSIARAQTDINTIKTTNLNLQSQVNTLNTQMEAGMNVTIDGAMVKNVNPESNYVNFVTGDNIALSNDNGSLKISAKSDGVVTNGNTGLVSGGTVYNAIQDALAGYGGEAGTALAGKANADASNIGKNADTDNSSAWGQALGTGTVSQNDDRLVTGKTMYDELRAGDGNYVKSDKTTGQNLQALDTAVGGLQDTVTDMQDDITGIQDDITGMKGDITDIRSDLDGKADKDLSNLSDSAKGVIRNIAQNSTDITSSDGSLTTTVTADNGKIVYDLSVIKNGKVEEGNTGILTGDTVYQAIKDINPYGDNVITGTDSGAVGKRNTVAGNGSYAIGNDNTIAEGSDDIYILGSNVNATGKNSVVLGKGSDGSQDNVVSVGSDGHERKIVHVANGNIAQGSTDAVNGGQLYDVREDLRHANGADIDDWSRKLGVGNVVEGDTGLVNGGTVYNALQRFTGSDAVTVDREYGALRVGASPKYDELPFVDFSNSQGVPRVLTGIATNIEDPSSAANVGYVNAIGQNIVNGVNEKFTRMDDRIDKVGAGAAAMAGLVPGPMDGDEKWSLSAAVGNYRSATAGAVGAFYKPTENVVLAVKGAFGNGENMVSGGIGVTLNKGNVPGVTKAQLVRTVNAQANEIQTMKAAQAQSLTVINEQAARIERLETALQQVLDAQQKVSGK